MKFSFMSFSCPECSFDEILELAGKYGYAGIEPRISANHQHGVEVDSSASFREECKQKSQTAGISICCIATSCRYADPAMKDEMINDTNAAIDLAGDVGSSRIRVFGGGIPEGRTREDSIDLVAESLKSVADHAADRGVAVCMETHDDWCDPAHVAAVMAQVDHPAIAVNWDIMHPVRVVKATMDESFEAVRPWIRHIHFHDGRTEEDGKLVLTPVGEGIIDHRRAVELLKGDGYDGYMSGEWIGWEPYDQHLPRELAIMRGYDEG